MGEYAKKSRIASRPASREMNISGISDAMTGSIPNSSMEAIMSGRARASSEMMGHRRDLAPSMKAKMTKAFGMDLSGVQIYRSEAMSGTGTRGLASGNKIVLSTDIDLNTTAGQAVLGHELSHIRAQREGIGMGHSGLWENAALEQQADTEGMMAARGLSAEGTSFGMATSEGMSGISSLTPLGPGMSASAGAPMQASKGSKFGGAVVGGAGKLLGGVSAIANLVTGGQMFGSLYQKLAKKKGAGAGIGRAALLLPTLITNLPSTMLGSIGRYLSKHGSKWYQKGDYNGIWNHDTWNLDRGGEGEDKWKAGQMLANNPENAEGREFSNRTKASGVERVVTGGTRYANDLFNPGDDPRQSWVTAKLGKLFSKIGGVNKRAGVDIESANKSNTDENGYEIEQDDDVLDASETDISPELPKIGWTGPLTEAEKNPKKKKWWQFWK